MKENIVNNPPICNIAASIKKRCIFSGKTISNPRVEFFKVRTQEGFFKELIMRLIKTLAIAEIIHAAFFKTPEQIRLEAIKQEILQQEDMSEEA
ncbi:MAG: hypothetical protein LBQ23_00410 [Puniceicoccales bacterium]|jgi:hypothetical protein|nr:hypothetical protein [Puniceicoccales bacterium]